MKLRTVREGKLRSLLRHSAPDRGYTVPDIDYRSLSGSVQIFFAVSCGDPAAFTGDSEGISFLEIARKERSMIRHGVRILAELRQRLRQLVNRFE